MGRWAFSLEYEYVIFAIHFSATCGAEIPLKLIYLTIIYFILS